MLGIPENKDLSELDLVGALTMVAKILETSQKWVIDI